MDFITEKANAFRVAHHNLVILANHAKDRLKDFTADITVADKMDDDMWDKKLIINTQLEPEMIIELYENFLRVDDISDLIRLSRHYTSMFYLYEFADNYNPDDIPYPEAGSPRENIQNRGFDLGPPFKTAEFAVNWFTYTHAMLMSEGNWQPEKCRDLIDKEIESRMGGLGELMAENKRSNKLNWTAGVSHFGFIVDLLIKGNYIENPASSFPKSAQRFMHLFDIDTTPQTLAKELSETTNSLSTDSRKKIVIPHRDLL